MPSSRGSEQASKECRGKQAKTAEADTSVPFDIILTKAGRPQLFQWLKQSEKIDQNQHLNVHVLANATTAKRR